MCKLLQVQRSSFYAWQRRPKSKRQIENERILRKILEIYEKKHRIYGYPRITKALPDDMKVSQGRVYRIMRDNGIKSKTARKYKPQTTDSNHNYSIPPPKSPLTTNNH